MLTKKETVKAKVAIKTFKPNHKVGFELELYIHSSVYSQFLKDIREVYPGSGTGNQRLSVVGDGSLNYHPGYNSIEIRTPPLNAETAFLRYDELLAIVTNYDQAGFIKTDAQCGLHVNISESKIFQNPDNAYNFTHKFIKYFDPIKWRKKFDRSSNQYCRFSARQLKQLRKTRNINFVGTQLSNHYSAINTENIHEYTNPKYRRLEIRSAGNTGYYANSGRMQNFLEDVNDAMNKASHASAKALKLV